MISVRLQSTQSQLRKKTHPSALQLLKRLDTVQGTEADFVWSVMTLLTLLFVVVQVERKGILCWVSAC